MENQRKEKVKVMLLNAGCYQSLRGIKFPVEVDGYTTGSLKRFVYVNPENMPIQFDKEINTDFSFVAGLECIIDELDENIESVLSSGIGECRHQNTQPHSTYGQCNDCGAIKTGWRSWGIADNMWFDSLHDAEFYKNNGRYPGKIKDNSMDEYDLTNAICGIEVQKALWPELIRRKLAVSYGSINVDFEPELYWDRNVVSNLDKDEKESLYRSLKLWAWI